MSSSPCAVKVILTTADSILSVSSEKGFVLPVFLSKGREFPQESARRVLKSVFGIQKPTFLSLPVITRIGIEEIPEEERKLWPKGVRTIPVVSFTSQVERGELSLPAGFSWLPKAGASMLLTMKEDQSLVENL